MQEDTPWGRPKPVFAEILDVKDGWVRYSLGGSMSDQRMKMSSFMNCYRLLIPELAQRLVK